MVGKPYRTSFQGHMADLGSKHILHRVDGASESRREPTFLAVAEFCTLRFLVSCRSACVRTCRPVQATRPGRSRGVWAKPGSLSGTLRLREPLGQGCTQLVDLFVGECLVSFALRQERQMPREQQADLQDILPSHFRV